MTTRTDQNSRVSRGSVVAVIGLAGGTGASTAAWRMAQGVRGSCLVDLDLWRGDLAQRLDLSPTVNLSDLVGLEPAGLDSSQLAQLVYPTNWHGGLVASPARAELAELISGDHVLALLEFVSSAVVIVDGGSHVHEAWLACCAVADEIVLVADGRPACRAQFHYLQDLLRRAGVGARVTVVAPRLSRRRRNELGVAWGVPVLARGLVLGGTTRRSWPPQLRLARAY